MKNFESAKENHEKKHFDNWAGDYDKNYHYLEPFTKYKIDKKFKELVKFIKSNYQGSNIKILEIGCGTGEYTKKIAERFPKNKIIGLDISSGILKIAKNKCKKLKNASFVSRSAYNTKFPKNSFDIIIGYYVLHHIDVVRFSKEAKRLLKRNGTLFFYEPNILNPIVYLIKSNKTLKKMVGDSPDEWAINPISIGNKLEGFNVVDISTSEFIWPVRFVPLKIMIELDTILGYFRFVPLLKYFGGSVQVLFQKK